MPTLADVEALVDQVRQARPEALDHVVTGWNRVGSEAGAILSRATAVDRDTGAAFLNDQTQVYDAAAATQRARAATGDGGERFLRIAEAVAVVRDELTRTRADVLAAHEQLRAELTAIAAARSRLAAVAVTMAQPEVDHHAVGLQARADQALNSAASRIATRLEAYDAVLASRTRTLTDLGFASPAPGNAKSTLPPAGNANSTFLLAAASPPVLALVVLAAVAAWWLASRESGVPVFPAPVGPALPMPTTGEGPLVGQADQRGPGTLEATGEEDYDPEFDYLGSGYSRDEVEDFINGHSGNATNEGRPTPAEIAQVLDENEPVRVVKENPDGSEFVSYHTEGTVNGRDVKVMVNPMMPQRSTAVYPRG